VVLNGRSIWSVAWAGVDKQGLLGNIFMGWTFLPSGGVRKCFVISELSLANGVP
jgi:hypothetical protein